MRLPWIVAALAALPGLPAGAPPLPRRQASAAPLLPRQAGAWQRVEKPRRYAGPQLFAYMDGAAEVHRMYGFRSLRVAKYARPGGTGRVKVGWARGRLI